MPSRCWKLMAFWGTFSGRFVGQQQQQPSATSPMHLLGGVTPMPARGCICRLCDQQIEEIWSPPPEFPTHEEICEHMHAGASCKKFGRAGLNCWEKLRSRCRRHRAARRHSCETPQLWDSTAARRHSCETPQLRDATGVEGLRRSCFPIPVDSGALGAPPAGSGAEPRKHTNFLRFEPYIVLTI